MPMDNQVEDNVEGRAILCMLKTNIHDHTIYRIRMDELRSLVESLGITIVGEVIQTRYRPFSKFFFGSGKAKEVGRKVRRLNADLVIFYNILKSSQKMNLIREFDCEVIDRYELTLEIFDRMASDSLSKFQIQAARLDKQAPFAKLQASINYRQDRPFFRSGGEYGFHGQMREITRNQARIREEVNRLMEEQSQRIFQRKRLGFPIICIAGFYNAGKTSLFNAITGDNKLVSDRPFTTLSSKYQRRFIDYETTVLFIDTIGFVLDLDPKLIQSFKLNLLDMRNADLVILLLEIDDPIITLNMKLNEGVQLLKEIGIPHERIIVVFNKLDKAPELEDHIGELSEIERYNLSWISISAMERKKLQELLYLIAEKIKELKENPPYVPEVPVFQRAETMVNRVLQNYPSDYQPSRRDPFRSLVSTILSQNTNSRNQATAYASLEKKVGVTSQRIDEASHEEISEAIKPAGMHNIRSKTLKSIARIVEEKYRGDLSQVFALSLLEAREELMELPGVGPKTADVALMFSSGMQVIPVDRHIERITKRLDLVENNAQYEDVRRVLEDAATPDRFRDVHLSMIRFGREICSKLKPRCYDCVLDDMCPYENKTIIEN